MIVVYTDAHQHHQPRHEIYDGVPVAYAETAARADTIIEALRSRPEYDIRRPRRTNLRHILAVHQRPYVEFIQRQSQQLSAAAELPPSYFMSDTYAPITRGTYRAARRAVDAALTGAQLVAGGEPAVYSLCRPPGHHAAHHAMGGYCYFNNAAIAAQFLSEHGRAAIVDVDFHHGNGTQEAFYDRSDVLYASLHAHPRDRYPYYSGFSNEQGRGTGKGFTINRPLPLGTGDKAYVRQLRQVLVAVQDFAPDYLVVSVGFDTFIGDPIGGFALTPPVYWQIGRLLAELNLPSLLIQEGGYNVTYLGELAANFLEGFHSFRKA